MRDAVVIIHNEDSKSDVYYGLIGGKLWNILRDIQYKRREQLMEHEVDVLEKIIAQKLGFHKINRFVCENDLSVFQIRDYVGDNYDQNTSLL